MSKGTDKAKRIVWRLQELKREKITRAELRRAIMFEAGTDERTIERQIEILTELKAIKRKTNYLYTISATALE